MTLRQKFSLNGHFFKSHLVQWQVCQKCHFILFSDAIINNYKAQSWKLHVYLIYIYYLHHMTSKFPEKVIETVAYNVSFVMRNPVFGISEQVNTQTICAFSVASLRKENLEIESEIQSFLAASSKGAYQSVWIAYTGFQESGKKLRKWFKEIAPIQVLSSNYAQSGLIL